MFTNNPSGRHYPENMTAPISVAELVNTHTTNRKAPNHA